MDTRSGPPDKLSVHTDLSVRITTPAWWRPAVLFSPFSRVTHHASSWLIHRQLMPICLTGWLPWALDRMALYSLAPSLAGAFLLALVAVFKTKGQFLLDKIKGFWVFISLCWSIRTRRFLDVGPSPRLLCDIFCVCVCVCVWEREREIRHKGIHLKTEPKDMSATICIFCLHLLCDVSLHRTKRQCRT